MTFHDVQTAHCAAHTSTELDCVDCTIAQQNAACAHLTTARKAKAFKAPKAKRSAALSARPVAAQTFNHVAGDVPPTVSQTPPAAAENPAGGPAPYRRLAAGEAGYDQVVAIRAAGQWACDSYDHNEAGGCSNPDCFKYARRHPLDTNLPGNPILEALDKMTSTPLQAALDGVGPAHFSDAAFAKGFMLAGNAYFTVRSQKTGARYTYRVSRAKCSRCGKLDCQCWANPNYFVSLLTGPDNEGDYTYLGMIRDSAFRATRATRAQEQGKPFAAFRYVWTALAAGRYPAQVEIWHEGRCGRCGRKLTVPESVERGIGPECAAKGGF